MRANSGKRRDEEAGFTMIEVLIAVALTAIAVTGVLGLYMVESRSSRFSRHQTEAAVLAEDKMEWLRTQSLPVGGIENNLAEPGGVANFFTRKWSVTPNASWIDYNVTVTWSEEGQTRTLTLASRRAP